MIYATFFCTITLLAYILLNRKGERKEKVKQRLASIVQTEKEESDTSQEKEKPLSLYRRIIDPIWREFKRSFKKRMPGEKVANLEMKLLQAGNPMGMTSVEFRLLQLVLFILLPTSFGLLSVVTDGSLGTMILFILIGLVIAIILPHFYIKQKINQRSKQALLELPDTLDLLTVSLEAGLGFDSALSKLVSKKDGVLAQEFQRCLEEIRLGRTRREALTGVKERLEVGEIKVLMSSILQAEKLGIGMVTVLRIQSEEVRDQRKQRAEEQAMKAPIKMLFPLVLFIFPSLFIVLLGPAVIQFLTIFAD